MWKNLRDVFNETLNDIRKKSLAVNDITFNPFQLCAEVNMTEIATSFKGFGMLLRILHFHFRWAHATFFVYKSTYQTESHINSLSYNVAHEEKRKKTTTNCVYNLYLPFVMRSHTEMCAAQFNSLKNKIYIAL